MEILKMICLAGGCFWGTEHYLKMIDGVVATEVGFANGNTAHPTYEEVYTDRTGYAEAVMVTYDPKVISLRFLVELYFKAIDPHSLNRQGADTGTRYRTGVYYLDGGDLPVLREVFETEEGKAGKPLAVELLPLSAFHPADEYHQNYLDKHADGYCHLPAELFEFARKANSQARHRTPAEE